MLPLWGFNFPLSFSLLTLQPPLSPNRRLTPHPLQVQSGSPTLNIYVLTTFTKLNVSTVLSYQGVHVVCVHLLHCIVFWKKLTGVYSLTSSYSGRIRQTTNRHFTRILGVFGIVFKGTASAISMLRHVNMTAVQKTPLLELPGIIYLLIVVKHERPARVFPLISMQWSDTFLLFTDNNLNQYFLTLISYKKTHKMLKTCLLSHSVRYCSIDLSNKSLNNK